MPQDYKILAQIMPDDTNEHTAYTVPSASATTVTSTTSSPFSVAVAPKSVSSNTHAIVSSVVVCNLHSGSETYDIRLKSASGVTDNNKEKLFHNTAIATGKTHVLSLGMGISAGNLLKVKSSTADHISFTIMGVEVT